MKKMLFIIGLIMVLVMSGCNSESNPKDETVSGAKDLRDGTYVRITGNIDAHLFKDWYTFSDSSGSITIQIEEELWARNGINPESLEFPVTVEIVGEVCKEKNQGTIIEVEILKIL